MDIKTSASNDEKFDVYSAIAGSVPSIIAIGLIRARASFQIEVSSAFATGLNMTAVAAWVHPTVFFALYMLFGILRFEALFSARFRLLIPFCGCLTTVVYAFATVWPQNTGIIILAIVISDMCTVYMTRVWGEGACSPNVNALILRIGLSFLVQYVTYTCLIVLPIVAQNGFTAVLPLLIAVCLLKSNRVDVFPTRRDGDKRERRGGGGVSASQRTFSITGYTDIPVTCIFLSCPCSVVLFAGTSNGSLGFGDTCNRAHYASLCAAF
jgi:hypothetical protein